MRGTHSIRQSSPTHCAHKLIGVVLLLVLVQDALHCVKLECEQCLGESLVVQVQGVVFTACASATTNAQKTRDERKKERKNYKMTRNRKLHE